MTQMVKTRILRLVEKNMAKDNYSNSSIRIYLGHIRNFLDRVQKHPAKIDESDIKEYFTGLKRCKVSTSLVSQNYTSLALLFEASNQPKNFNTIYKIQRRA